MKAGHDVTIYMMHMLDVKRENIDIDPKIRCEDIIDWTEYYKKETLECLYSYLPTVLDCREADT